VALLEGEHLMITVTDLSKTYRGDVKALRNVSLEIESGMFGLVGPNGAGKTTLIRILAGLLRPTSGHVQVLGHDVVTTQGKQAVKSVLGYLPQELGLYPDLSAYEFLDYIAILKGLTNGASRNRQIHELLEMVGLTKAGDRRMKTYSGGMKRRVGIAQAFLGDPQLLIVDEPTAGLDPEERVHLRNILADMAGQRTVILSTHIIEDVSQSCTDLAVLHHGQVLFRGSPQEVIARARGKVWTIFTTGEKPDAGLVVVSTLQLSEGIQYRVLGDPPPGCQAEPVEPSLEDGYIWLMRKTLSESSQPARNA
jgi:ABC-2 type transport system ATP-binding protein